MLDAGVQARTSQKLGHDFTVDSLLKEGFTAVFMATGGWDTQLSERSRSKISSKALPGVQLLLDFILDQREGKGTITGKQIMILGGGNSGLEAARTCVRQGAKNVYMVIRRPHENSPFTEEALKTAEKEGVQFYFQSVVTRMTGEEDSLTHVEVAPISEQGDEESYRERELIPVDILLTGSGRFPELIYVPVKEDVQEGEEKEASPGTHIGWETLVPYPSPFALGDMGMFRPGEVTSDYKAVVEAIGSGRRAASSIHRFLTEVPVEAPFNMIRKNSRILSLEELEPVSEIPRQKMPELSQEEQANDPAAEIELGLSEEQALQEAKRCLQCGLICYRRVQGELH